MLVKALLVAFWAGLCSLDDGGMQLQIRKPLLAGTITGLILGDLTQGLIIGGTLELMWLGVNSVARIHLRISQVEQSSVSPLV